MECWTILQMRLTLCYLKLYMLRKRHQDLKEFDIKTKFNIINHERNFQIT